MEELEKKLTRLKEISITVQALTKWFETLDAEADAIIKDIETLKKEAEDDKA